MTGEPAPEPAEPPLLSAPASAPLLPPPPPGLAPPPPPSFPPLAPTLQAAVVAPPVPLPPPTAETLAIPLGPRRLVGQSLDLLTRSDAGLRSASFYIGLVALLTVGPAVALLGLGMVAGGESWLPWWFVAAIPAGFGFVVAGVESRALAVAVIGGRAEGRPLRLRESIAVARSHFWSILAAQVLVGLITVGVEVTLTLVLALLGGRVDVLGYAVSVVGGVAVGAPFIYASAGIVLGEAGAGEALRRSVGLARARPRLAVVVTLFAVLAGLVSQFGLGIAADTVVRVLDGAGLAEDVPAMLVVPLVAALVFAYGTLILLVEAIAAAPAVHAFLALTHYSGGLERGRRAPLPVVHAWDPWFTPGLAVGALVAATAMVLGALAIRW